MDSNRQYGKEVRILFSVLLKIPFRFACQTCPSFIWMYRTYEQYYSVNCGLFAVVWKWGWFWAFENHAMVLCLFAFLLKYFLACGIWSMASTKWLSELCNSYWYIQKIILLLQWDLSNDYHLIELENGIRDIYYIHKARHFELGDPQINMQKNFETK